jgi:RimJ/RimL family protein N-acetyltransferase
MPNVVNTEYIHCAAQVGIRKIQSSDLDQLSKYPFTVSITEPLTDRRRIEEVFLSTGFWTPEAGAVAIVELSTRRLIGTSQFYRSGPCIHGLELGYILHERADRGKGFARIAVRMISDHLFTTTTSIYRQQLLIETWNTASLRLAERCGFTREGILRSSGLGNGEPGDSIICARTRRDWHEEQHALYSPLLTSAGAAK